MVYYKSSLSFRDYKLEREKKSPKMKDGDEVEKLERKQIWKLKNGDGVKKLEGLR